MILVTDIDYLHERFLSEPDEWEAIIDDNIMAWIREGPSRGEAVVVEFWIDVPGLLDVLVQRYKRAGWSASYSIGPELDDGAYAATFTLRRP